MKNKPNIAAKSNVIAASFDPKDYVTKDVTLKEVWFAKDAFDAYDTDQSGSIDLRYMKNVMSALGFQTAQNRPIFWMLADLDPDGQGLIDFKLWLHMMTDKMSNKTARADANILFAILDDQRRGKIAVKDLKRSAKDLHLDISDQELNQLILLADRDKDGYVTDQDFYLIMTKEFSYQ